MVFKLEDKQEVTAAAGGGDKTFSEFSQWGNFLRKPHQLHNRDS